MFQKYGSHIFSCRYGQYITGIHYQHGIDGAPKNLELAKHYFLMSAEQDYAEAQAALGILLVSQNDHDQGKKWLDRAATKVFVLSLRDTTKID